MSVPTTCIYTVIVEFPNGSRRTHKQWCGSIERAIELTRQEMRSLHDPINTTDIIAAFQKDYEQR